MSRFNLLCTPRLFSQLHYRHQVIFQLAELWGYHIMCRNPFKRDYCWIRDEAYSWLILLFVNEVSIRSLQFWECYHTGTPAEVPGNTGSAAGSTHTRHTSSLSNSGFKHMLYWLELPTSLIMNFELFDMTHSVPYIHLLCTLLVTPNEIRKMRTVWLLRHKVGGKKYFIVMAEEKGNKWCKKITLINQLLDTVAINFSFVKSLIKLMIMS